MTDAITAVEETIEDVIEDVEDIFSPKPGGMVDRHRKERARREAANKEAEQTAERIEEASYKAVKVAIIKPNTTATNTFTIQPGANTQILPLSPYRFKATIAIVTA